MVLSTGHTEHVHVLYGAVHVCHSIHVHVTYNYMAGPGFIVQSKVNNIIGLYHVWQFKIKQYYYYLARHYQ